MNTARWLIAGIVVAALVSFSLWREPSLTVEKDEQQLPEATTPATESIADEPPPLSRVQKIANCATTLKATEPALFHFPCIGQCLCEMKVDGVKGIPGKLCGGIELVALAQTQPGLFSTAEGIDCMCNGYMDELKFDEMITRCMKFAQRG